jgi:transposase InsO family protein
VYFLVEKSVALVNFKYFKKSVEMEMDAYIKCLRTDRGGEFTSQDFNDFCKENGIKRQLTAAYAPQQNGVAERKNRTIMNLVRSMLSEKKIPQTFWPEAVNWTIYILNRSPTLAVKNITPEEAWSGIKPSVEHFRVFGYLAHVHVPDAKRTKLKNKSIACVLLGVSEESKAYRLYNPITKKIITSRDVVFEENKSWNWDKEHVVTVLEWGDNDEEATVS